MTKLSTIVLKINFILIVALLSFRSNSISGAEFVIMNRVITWDVNAGDAFWNIQVDSRWPANWLSPNDYYNGKIYTRYEVLSVATNEPFRMQFGIFQWHPSAAQHTSCGELCEYTQPLQGAGSVAINSSSPSGWWSSDGGVDFSRVVTDFQSMSVIIYSQNPSSWPISPPTNGGDPTGVIWSQRSKWFPVTIRATVIAVSKGSVFSGWDNYIPNPATQKPTPNYGIDYINETTDIEVPSTDEFSHFPTMYGAESGTGIKMNLNPGEDAYFRTKAGDGLRQSEIQHFDIPCRPVTPTFTLDKINHQTTTTVSSDYEFSDYPDMSGAVTGSGTFVSIPAGTTKYFRKKATTASFKSNVQALNEATILPIAHELLLFNDTIDYPNETDTNGFYYFNYNADMPVNWRTPDDYYYGEIYARYEIISQKTEAPIGLQFGIWQLLPPETGELHETMSSISGMNGTGSVVTAHSSPVTWWRLDGGFDYTKMNLTWHFGINTWQLEPSLQQIRQENPAVWANRNTHWFPMKVSVTIVAVAWDQTFSGWENYINTNPGSKKPVPNIGIDFINESTDNMIPATIEYSYNANMSYAVNGDGQKLALTPGQDIYFRTRAGSGLYASDIQHLVVPARPVAPVFTIDFLYEKTTQNITSDIEYASTDSFKNVASGTGSRITVVPGQDLYFRKKASGTFFTSEIQHLVIPARPATPSVTIDFMNERTVQDVSSDMEYSTSPSYSNPVSGTGTKISLVPGQDLYLWKKANASSFASLDFHLVVPNRPAEPTFTIDFTNEKTMETVNSGYSYSISSAFTNPINGVGNKVSLIPGQDIYFMMNPTSVAFASVIQHITVPERPATPNISIDYLNEISSVVSSTLEWSVNASLSPATQGTNATLNLIPGTDLYFRQKATSGTFKSEIQHLVVPVRPSTPNVLVNYSDETTGIIPSSIVWSLNATMTPVTQGQNLAIPVTPGIDLYFMTQATQSGFKSSVQHLIIANRPAAPAYSINYPFVKTNEPVITADDYATNSNMTNAIPGTNTAINLMPGTDLYFRTRSTSSSFCSPVQFLEVKPRPVTPEFTIDFINGTTLEIVDPDIAYSPHANFSVSANGTGEVLEIEPGKDVYFMQNPTSSSFGSEVFHLVVPGSNFLGYSGADTVSSDKVVMYAILDDPAAVLSLDDIRVTNGTAENLRQGNLFDVYPLSKGNVSVVIPANTVINNSFASNEVIVYFNNTSTGVNELPGDHLVVYPNPSKTGIIFVKSGLNIPCSIDVLSTDGVVLKSFIIQDNQFINIQDLNKGMYLLHIRTGRNYSVHKVVLE